MQKAEPKYIKSIHQAGKRKQAKKIMKTKQIKIYNNYPVLKGFEKERL